MAQPSADPPQPVEEEEDNSHRAFEGQPSVNTFNTLDLGFSVE
jgi:hypothetical protein|eukprot:SAG25_NODE_235_length_11344_cov_3.848911_4_plen_43_part_00